MNYYSRNGIKKNTRKRKVVFIIFALLSIATLLLWYFVLKKPIEGTTDTTNSDTTIQSKQEEQYSSIDLQPTIDDWIQKYPASYSISIYDLQNGKIIGQHQPEKELFAASLYKIFVAYLSLVDFQTNAQNPDEILISGQTKKECVDKMIRSSDSPCGEAMMAEMGQLNLNQRVKDIGMKSTIFNGIQTSASDTSIILKYINEGRDLNQENTNYLLDAMLTQEAKFKRGLQTGAPDAKWQTKVGWNEDINYHDIGIMTLKDGRKFAVSILGQGSGSPEPIADFAKTIYDKLSE